MSEPNPSEAAAAPPTVFVSYASEDREAARLIQRALPGYGLEVWFDESELGGGEAWDQKIRRQIRECDYFMPIVSAQTERRLEGYFRREWRLAVERTLDMADDHLFLLPIVIDDTNQSGARVPEKFLTVQWLKVPGGQPTRAFESLCKRLSSGSVADLKGDAKTSAKTSKVRLAGSDLVTPEFPLQEPGQPVRFWVEVAGWAGRSLWVRYKRFPKWIRITAVVWLCIALISRCDSSKHERASDDLTPAKLEKLKEITQTYQGNSNAADLAKLGASVASEFDLDDDEPTEGAPLLAIAFTAPPADAAGTKLANAAFALTYGMLAIAHHGQVALTNEPLAPKNPASAIERGKSNHSKYVLTGTVEPVSGAGTTGTSTAAASVLTVKLTKVADGSVLWSKSYPTTSAEPVAIAAEVEKHVPSLSAG